MQVRLGFLTVVAVALSACSDDRSVQLAAGWGCGPVEGIGSISGDRAPDWVLIGEFTETNETPAAVADIVCNLATDERPLFVGVSEYVGGDTDAEAKMLARLDAMIAKGAPLIVERIGEDHPYTVRNKSRAEKAWARTLTEKVAAAGAARAVLLLPHANAIAEPIPPIGDRFAGYDPMPVFLEGTLVSLEVAPNPAVGLPGPAIRIHREMQNGFHGQLALNRMTRPRVALILPGGQSVAQAVVDDPKDLDDKGRRLAAEIQREAQAWTQRLLEEDAMDNAPVPNAAESPGRDSPDVDVE